MKKEKCPKLKKISKILLCFVFLLCFLISSVAALPSVPTGLTGYPNTGSCESIVLKWDNIQSPGIYKFYKDGVYRKTASGSVVGNFRQEADYNLMGSATYSYQISFVDQQGVESGLTAPVYVTTNPCHLKTLDEINFSLILVTFNDVAPPFSVDYAKEKIFTGEYSLKNYVSENSYGRQNLSGSVYGWYILPGNVSDYCEVVYPNGLGDICHLDLSHLRPPTFQNTINYLYIYGTTYDVLGSFNLYKILHAPYSGINEMLIDSSVINKCFNTNNRISRKINYTYQIYNECQYNQYDPYDPGGLGYGHYHALNKEMAGFLHPHEISVAYETGEYTLDVFELPSDGVKEVKIPIVDNKIFYFLEYRRPIGFDALLDESPFINSYHVPDGVQLRLRAGDDYGNQDVVQLFGTNGYINETNSFYDPYRGIRISLIEKDDTSARIFIERNLFDATLPNVDIVSPQNGQEFCCDLTFIAVASDNIMVDKVEFYIDSHLVFADLTAPYNLLLNLNAIPDGDHSLEVKAFDLSGNMNSDSVLIRVDHAPGFYNISYDEHKIIDADDLEGGKFGQAVDIKNDIAIIGSSNINNLGRVAVYNFNGVEWIKTGQINNPGSTGNFDNFGDFVKIMDENRVIISSSSDRNGRVYLYEKNGVDWVNTQILAPSSPEGNAFFGNSVDYSDGKIVISSYRDRINGIYTGSLYIFEYNENTDQWEETQRLVPSDITSGTYLGSGGVSIFGNSIIAGAYRKNNFAGGAYYFEYNAGLGLWEEKQVVLGINGENLGSSVDIYENTVLIGSPSGLGKIDVYEKENSALIKKDTVIPSIRSIGAFGNSLSIGGNTFVAGEYHNSDLGFESGTAYVFKNNGTKWVQTERLIGGDTSFGDEFGQIVSTDGKNAIIGALKDDGLFADDGSAYIFEVGDCDQADENCDGAIDYKEIGNYIEGYYNGSNSIQEVSESIWNFINQ